MPFLPPNQQRQSTKGKHIPVLESTQTGPSVAPTPQVCIQLPMSVDKVTMCYGAEHPAAIDRHLLLTGPTAANPPHAAAAGEWDRQMDTASLDRPCSA